MAERQEFFLGRTVRPDRRSSALRVGDVLALPAVQEGAPTVLVGGPALEAGVRWVHVSDSADVARLLDGGELLLTTGAAWPTGTAALRVLVAELAAIGVSGIVIELGPRMSRVPDAVIEACAAAGLALVALAVEVKFVAVTEAVHRALIEAQTAALRERQRLHDLFTALSLRGAPADLIVSEVARALDVPVHLETWQERSSPSKLSAFRSARLSVRPARMAVTVCRCRRAVCAGAGSSRRTVHRIPPVAPPSWSWGDRPRLRLPRRRGRRVDRARAPQPHRGSPRRALRP